MTNPPAVLLMTLIFPPDGVSTAQLLGEIVEDLAANGNAVKVITTSPHYNTDEAAQLAQPLTWRWHRLVGTSHFGDVEVLHLRMPQKASGAIFRILQWAWFHVGSLLLALSMRKQFDVILTVSPPPTVAVVAALIRRLYRVPVVYAVWELYPEILVKLGHVAAGSRFHRLLQSVERLTYRESDAITVLHESMRDAVLEVAPTAAAKTTVIPTFADVEFLRPGSRDTPLRDEYGLGDGFVVGYAGNVGSSEDLTVVINAAALCPDVKFLICGDGTERRRLELMAADANLANVVFTGHLPYARVPEITASCDVCLVVLTKGIGDEALPSKAYRVMACGRPILAVADEGTPLARLVTSQGIGQVAPPDDAERLAETIAMMRREELDLVHCGEHARSVAESSYSRTAVTGQYITLLAALTTGRRLRQ